MQRFSQGINRNNNSNPPILRTKTSHGDQRREKFNQKENHFSDDGSSQIEHFNARSNILTSKNPSFSLTSECSRRYENHSISEIKAYQRNVFSNTTNSQISCLQNSKVYRKLGNDLEDLFGKSNNYQVNKPPVNLRNQIGYQSNRKIVDYKLGLKTLPVPGESSYLRRSSVTSAMKQTQSAALEKKLCSDEEGVPFTTLMSYQPEEQKDDNTEKDNSFGSSGSESSSLIESLRNHKKIEEKFKKVTNPFKGQFDTLKQVQSAARENLKTINPNINSLQVNQDFEGSTFNQKQLNLQRNTIGGTPDMMYYGQRNQDVQLQNQKANGWRNKQPQQFYETVSVTQRKDQVKITQRHSEVKLSNTELKKHLKESLGHIKSIKGNAYLSITKQRNNHSHQYLSAQVKHKIRPPYVGAPKISEIKLLKPKVLIDETEQEDSIDSQELSNKKVKQQSTSNLIYQTIINQQSSKEIFSPVFTKEQQNTGNMYSPEHQQQLLSKVFSFNESRAGTESRNSNLQRQAFSSLQDTLNPSSQNEQNLEVIRNVIQQNLWSANSAQKRAKWDLAGQKTVVASVNLESNFSSNHTQGNPRSKGHLLFEVEKAIKNVSKEQQKPDSEKSKFDELQKQYLTIKMQLLELKHEEDIKQIQEKQTKQKSKPSQQQVQAEVNIGSVLSFDEEVKRISNEEKDLSKLSYSEVERESEQSDHKGYKKVEMSHKVKKLLHKQQVRERQSGSHLFKSVDLKNSQNFERQFSPEERKNIVKTTIKDQLRDQNSTLTKQMHFIEKASAMKSQLQLGLRKLSYKVDQDRTKDQLRQRRDQPRKSSMKRVKKSHQSQVSFVGLCYEDGCFSSQSSCKYKDCFSSQKYKSVRKPEEKSREREIFSSGSSKYYLANDGDSESLCSCCQNEFIHQSRNMTSHPSQRSLKTQQIPRRQSGRLPKLQVENSVLVGKSSKLVNQKSHQKHQSSKKLREDGEKRQSQGKQKSHQKSNKKQSKDRSQDKVRISNKLSQQQWQIPQQMIQQMKLRQSLDNIQQIWPSLNPTLQYQISQQLQTQPQIYPNGFQQQNFSIFMPSQPMLMPGILNQSQTINQLPCPLLLDNPLALPLQTQFSLQANQMALESQREQIEAIENLIKIAKSKLESTRDDEDECKYRKTRNSKGLSNRKENVYNTYDQSSRQEFNDAEYFSKGSIQSTKNRDSQNFKERRSESKQELLKKQTSPKIMSQLDRLQSQIKKHISQSELSNRWDERPSIGNNKLNRIQEERSNERDPQALKNKDIKPYKAQRIDLTEDFSLKFKKVGQFNDDHTALNTTDQSKAQIFDDNQSIQNQPLKVDLTNQVQAFLPNQIKKSKTQKPNTWKMEFSVNDENQDGSQTTVNLADAFKRKLADQFEEKMNQRVAKVKEIKEKKDFTKQELLERKKELLKQARTQLQSRQQSQHPQLDEEKATNTDNPLVNTKVVKVDISQQRDSKEPLMQRLSTGQRPEISRKDMLKLTNKNYELLPEIQRKKYEESKKEDLKKRVAMVKDMEKKRRETVVKKRNEINKIMSRTQTAKTQDEFKD